MPWCEHCAKFWTPSSMKADGSCPTCGRTPARRRPARRRRSSTAKDVNVREMAGEDAKAPWHFKLLMALRRASTWAGASSSWSAWPSEARVAGGFERGVHLSSRLLQPRVRTSGSGPPDR